jgi:hypothetical protein
LFTAFSLAGAFTPVSREQRFTAYFLFLMAIAARPEVFFHRDQGGRFMGRNSYSTRPRKLKNL